ncbi:MAG: glycosyltransferase family 2 protein [Burkholderiales bacterium]|nr:glycosyltransferase family 2 protein [Burkholderiales bacterium]
MRKKSNRPFVVISILNWNTAAETIRCVTSALLSVVGGIDFCVVVLDNGSSLEDWNALNVGLQESGVQLLRMAKNLGFAGGHNVVIQSALEKGADYVWLLNSDAVVEPGALQTMVVDIQNAPECGAISPVILALHDHEIMDFCGALYDWTALESRRPNNIADAQVLQAQHPKDMWLHGTAPLYRLDALKEVGLLDKDLFAYYEDNDLGVRLSRAGWLNKMSFDSRVFHPRRTAIHFERPEYYFYLMARNGFLFWNKYTPAPYRRFLKLRLLSRSLLESSKLHEKGFLKKSNACLCGLLDGINGVGGPPGKMDNFVWVLHWISKIIPYRVYIWLK